jgi:hypothetical protein
MVKTVSLVPRVLDRYLDSLERDRDLLRPKTIQVAVSAPEVDRLAGQLNEALAEIARAEGMEGSHFSIRSGSLSLWEKVRWNPWSLHQVMDHLAKLSQRFPDLVFSVEFEEPDRGGGTLRGGEYEGVPFSHLDRWVARFPPPDLSESFSSCSLRCAVSAAMAERLRERLGNSDLVPDGLRISAIDRADGIDIVAEAEAPGRAFLLLLLASRVLHEVSLDASEWVCRVSFDGSFEWNRVVTSYTEAADLRLLLGESAGRATREQEPEPPPPPLTLARLEGAAGVLQGEEVEFEDPHGRYARLASDGSFVPTGLPPRVRSSDGRYTVSFRPGADRSTLEWADRDDATTRNVSSKTAEFDRWPLGFIGHDLVIVESSIRIGYIRQRFVLHAPGGAERAGQVHINSRRIALDDVGARMFLIAELDGVRTLLQVTAASLEQQVLHTFADDEQEPRELIAFRGALFGVFRDRRETTFSRFDESGFRRFATIPEMLDLDIIMDGSLAYAITREPSDTGDERPSHVHEVSMIDGQVRSTTPSGDGAAIGRVERLATGGRWIALVSSWQARSSVHLLEAGEPRRAFAVPSGHVVSGIAVSATGALALAIRQGDRPGLVLVRGEQEATFALPARLDPRRWVKPDAP